MRSDAPVKAALSLGFGGVAAAIAVAHRNPATNYELSIYWATPPLFWAICTVALVISILTVFSATSRGTRASGAFLGGVTMTAIVTLPIVRGYHYLGEHDPLSHLGTAKSIQAGQLPPTDLPYPIVHTLGSVLQDVTGLPLNHAMLLLVVVFIVCFFVFVPLVVRELTGDVWTAYVGLFSGLLLLPINHVGTHIYLFPTSQAITYAPAFLFVFFLLYRKRTLRHSAMFLLTATAFLLLHPQQAANLLLFFGVIAVMQIGNDFLRGNRLSEWREWILPEVTYFAAVFVLWVTRLEIFWDAIEAVVTIPFESRLVGGKAAARTGSLAAVGGSLPEVFVKLFLVSFGYVLLTGTLLALVLRQFRGIRSPTARDTATPDGGTDRMLPLYVYGGLIAVTTIFVVYFVGGISDQIFRHLGMLMVFATILGSIAIGRALRYLGHRWSDGTARRTVALVLVVFVFLSLPVVFASPYVYYYSHHVTEKQIHGYETTFENQAEGIVFDDIRSNAYRYGHAIHGTKRPAAAYYAEGWREADQGIPDHFVHRSLRWYYDEPRYIPVPEADRVRDPVLWDGFRFSNEDFDYLDTEPGINRVQTNGGYDLYVVDPVDDPR